VLAEVQLVLRVKLLFKSSLFPLFRLSTGFLVLNVLFFGFVLAGALLAQFPGIIVYELPASENVFVLSVHPLLLVVEIFLFNLFVSGFLLTTLSGLVFFVLPLSVVLWRALLWGSMIALLPSPEFFWALDTFVLEGEAYVIAALAGVILGLSWLKPDWVFRGEKSSRREAVKKAFGECVRLYVLVAILLLVSAVVETVTIVLALAG
jgi:hypothetical protein